MKFRLERIAAHFALLLFALSSGAQSATADVITFTYYNPVAIVAYGYAYDHTLGLGVGPLVGLSVSASMTISFDRSVTPTGGDPNSSYCDGTEVFGVGTNCGISGSASINGQSISIAAPYRNNTRVEISNYGTAGQELASFSSITDPGPATSENPTRQTTFSFNSQDFTGQAALLPLPIPLLRNFDFTFLSFTQLYFANLTNYPDPMNQSNCGNAVCGGFFLGIRPSQSELGSSVFITIAPDTPPPNTTVPEPSTIALIGVALLSLFGLGMMRRRADA